MKRLLILLLAGILLFTCCACGEETTENTAVDTKNEYPFTATLDEYPDVLISAKSLEALNEVVAALSSKMTASSVPTTTTVTTTSAVTTTSTVITTADTTVPTTQTTVAPIVPTNPPTTATQMQSSSSLGETEQAIFDLLTNTLYRFTNPASVKVVKLYAYQPSGERYFLSLTSMTDKGGYETKLYTLDESGSYGSIFSEFQIRTQADLIGLTMPACDIAALNRALDNYYVSMGWK